PSAGEAAWGRRELHPTVGTRGPWLGKETGSPGLCEGRALCWKEGLDPPRGEGRPCVRQFLLGGGCEPAPTPTRAREPRPGPAPSTDQPYRNGGAGDAQVVGGAEGGVPGRAVQLHSHRVVGEPGVGLGVQQQEAGGIDRHLPVLVHPGHVGRRVGLDQHEEHQQEAGLARFAVMGVHLHDFGLNCIRTEGRSRAGQPPPLSFPPEPMRPQTPPAARPPAALTLHVEEDRGGGDAPSGRVGGGAVQSAVHTPRLPLPSSPEAAPAAARGLPAALVSCRCPLRYQVRLGAAARQVKARLSASRKLLTDRARPSILVSDVATTPAAERRLPAGGTRGPREKSAPPAALPGVARRSRNGSSSSCKSAGRGLPGAETPLRRGDRRRRPGESSQRSGGGAPSAAGHRAASILGCAARRERPEHRRPLTSRMRQQRLQPTGTSEIPTWISRDPARIPALGIREFPAGRRRAEKRCLAGASSLPPSAGGGCARSCWPGIKATKTDL
ncbi:hypothetical protein E2320_007260, partial [Naja naja]